MIFLSVIFFLIILIVIYSSISFDDEGFKDNCYNVNALVNLNYDVCYDRFSKILFLEIHRGTDDYNIDGISLSFFDGIERNYILESPVNGESIYRRIKSDKNPLSISLLPSVSGVFSCGDYDEILVGFCPINVSFLGANSSLNLISEAKVYEYREVVNTGGSFFNGEFDFSSYNLKCKSDWQCGKWQECIDGFSKRDCVDKNNCIVSTSFPEKVKLCSDSCVPDWQCTWSECYGGKSSPNCFDKNSCGVDDGRPEEINCKESCTPEIICENWSECKLDYNFIDFSQGDYKYSGISSKMCIDKNNCVNPKYYTHDCSVSVDIYSKEVERCGKNYTGIYNKLTNELVAILDKGNEKDPYLNVDLSGRRDFIYCDYCYDGVRNFDEEGIDCGGSCVSCKQKTVYEKYDLTYLDRLIYWVYNLF